MLAAAVVGILVIPALYVVFQTLRERIKGLLGAPKPDGEPAPRADP
jgi:hypothetical protein